MIIKIIYVLGLLGALLTGASGCLQDVYNSILKGEFNNEIQTTDSTPKND